MGHSLALNAIIDRSTAISVMKLAPTDFRKGHAGFTGGGERAQLDGFMPSNNVLSMSNLYSSAFFTRFLPSKERRRVQERGHKGSICGMQREIDVDW